MMQSHKIAPVLFSIAAAIFAARPCFATEKIDAPPKQVKTLDSTIALSIEESVLIGLKNNHDLNIQQLEPQIAGAFEQIERGVYNPELTSQFLYGREHSTETARATEDQFSVIGSDISGAVGLTQKVPIGMQIDTTLNVRRNESNRTPTQESTRVGLTFTQQLLRGLGPTVNLAAIRLAELDTRASRFEVQAVAQALVADIETNYWRYAAAAQAIAVVEKSLEVAQAQLVVVETRIEVGTHPENERAAALSEVALRKQALIDAKSYRNLERYRLLAKIYPEHPIHRVTEFNAVTLPDADNNLKVDPDESIALARKSRPEIAEAKLRLQQGDLEIAVTRNGRLPKLELFIQLGKSGYADTFTGSVQDIGGPNYDAAAGLRLSHLLGNRPAKAKETIARATKKQAREALANLKSIVQTDVLIALNELERAFQQVTATRETTGFREQTLLAEQAKYEVGTGTMLAVTLAQRDLLQSRIDEIKARVAYRIAKTQLYLAEGTLLERRGISLAP